MSTGFKRTNSPVASGSVAIIACPVTAATNTSGDGWSVVCGGSGLYTFTFTNGFSSLLGYSFGFGHATALSADDGVVGPIVTTVSASAGTILITNIADAWSAADTAAAADVPSGVTVYHTFILEMVGK